MLQSISWADYCDTLLFCAAIYYMAIVYLYYRKELLNLIGVRQVEANTFSATSIGDYSGVPKSHSDEEHMPKPVGDVDITPVLQSFTGEIKAYLEEAAAHNVTKQEILNALQQISAKYQVLNTEDNKVRLIQDVYSIASRYLPGIFKNEDFSPYLFH